MNVYRMSREELEDYATSLEQQLRGVLAAHEETLRRKTNLMESWLVDQRRLFELRTEVRRLHDARVGQGAGPG